jgi:anthranilate synthase
MPYRLGLKALLRDLDEARGIYVSCGYEYPGRHSRWDFVCVRPPLELIGLDRTVVFRPLNERGVAINAMLASMLRGSANWKCFREDNGTIYGELKPAAGLFPEEERARRPSVLSVLRELFTEFRPKDGGRALALAGAFGYDLFFQFEPMPLRLSRENCKDAHLFFCDDIILMDRKTERVERTTYEFEADGVTTRGLDRVGERVPDPPDRESTPITTDYALEEYSKCVEAARDGMRLGNYYQIVLAQTFKTGYSGSTSELFELMRRATPSPFEFLVQFANEQLVGASPELFFRAEGRRIESCPVAGTAPRTGDPLADAETIRNLLISTAEESKLTMCTDVDRSDKSRVCEPGSVRVIGRRLIEGNWGASFQTVDHVEGMLRDGMDALDGFASHIWPVAMMGAPKRAAAAAIESLEKTARRWFGGAVGILWADGEINAGMLANFVSLRDGYATYPAAATVVYDSDPHSAYREARLKASWFIRVLGGHIEPKPVNTLEACRDCSILIIGDNGGFIQTLASYAREIGALAITAAEGTADLLDSVAPSLIIISPGPRAVALSDISDLTMTAIAKGVPIFAISLGMAGVVEALGGDLEVLDYPMHGKRSLIKHHDIGVFKGLPQQIQVGRYDSRIVRRVTLPAAFEVTAEADDGAIMGLRHREYAIEAVQFQPCSILSASGDIGLKLIANAIRLADRT